MPNLELSLSHLRGTPEISLPEALFEKTIEDDEEIARPHFLYLEFRYALFPVDPRVGHHSVAVTAHNRLQRQFDGQIEMLREQRLDTGDHGAAVHFECVGHIVTGNAEQQLDEPVSQPV